MKNTLELRKPITVVGEVMDKLTYDDEEISIDLYQEACGKATKANTGAMTVSEVDYNLHFYLGCAAIIAVNQKIDWTDLEAIKGRDLVRVSDIGRNFTLDVDESAPDSSGELSEATGKPTTPASKSSDKTL